VYDHFADGGLHSAASADALAEQSGPTAFDSQARGRQDCGRHPLHMSGDVSPWAAKVQEFAEELKCVIDQVAVVVSLRRWMEAMSRRPH
jgi:hypothetical protein